MATIAVPVWSVVGENDEFIKTEHARYIADSIPGAKFVSLPIVSHFAPLQRPELFNTAMLDFLAAIR
jgi:pimeloyl-ACP methyl ester carboxylesterase